VNILTKRILHDLEQLPETMQSETLDFVQFLKTKLEKNKIGDSGENRNQLLADVLDEASQSKLFKDIEDPAAWQTEIREDRHRPTPNQENVFRGRNYRCNSVNP